MVQDLDSHDHIPPVKPTWVGFCRMAGVSPKDAPESVHEDFEQAVDQYEYELGVWMERNAPGEYKLAA